MDLTSDCESILTEDFASKFTEIVTEENSKDSGFSCGKSERDSLSLMPNNKDKFTKLDVIKENCKSQSFSTVQGKPSYKDHETESLATEGFEEHFQNLLNNNCKSGANLVTNRSGQSESCNTSINVDIGNLSNVQPLRRDIMNKFLAKYALDENQIINEMNMDEKKVYNYPKNANENFLNLQFFGRENNVEEINNKDNIIKNNLANEIRSKSLRIQNEIHEERRRKMDIVPENPFIYDQTPRDKLEVKIKELDHLTDKMRQARADREKITAELNQLKTTMQVKTSDLRKDTKWIGENKNSNEIKQFQNNIPSNQIKIMENQLCHLNFKLNEKKFQLNNLESIIRQRLKEIEELENIGLSRQEIERVIEERNDLYEILRQSEEIGNDRYKLEKELTEAKVDLSIEYKRSREKIMTLEEELDSCFKKISDLYEDRDKINRDLLASKETVQRLQDDMNEVYQERNNLRYQVDKYKDEIESERMTSRDLINQEKTRIESYLATEEAQFKIKQSEMKNEILSLTKEVKSLTDKNASLRSSLSQAEEECQNVKKNIEQCESEYRENLQRQQEEKNHIIEKLKKDFYNNQINEMQNLKTEFDSEQMRSINNLRDCYKQQVGDLQLRIENKSQEIQDLRNDIRKLKSEFIDKEERLKSKYENEITHLKEEIKRTTDSYKEKKAIDLEEIKTRYDSLISKMKKEVNDERLMNERLRDSVDKANESLAKKTDISKTYKLEKTMYMNKIKEFAKEKLQEEYKNIKQFYEKELESQLTVVEKAMQEKNAQLILKSKENKELQKENEDRNQTLISILNDFIDDIRQKCSDLANDAKFVLPNWENVKVAEIKDISKVLQSISKNVQICCQEYSQYYQEIVKNLTKQQEQILKSIQDKASNDIEIIREQISKDHANEINSITKHHKQELNKMKLKYQNEIENIQMNLKNWKSETAERLAQKLQKEFRKEMERKSNKQDIDISSTLSLRSFKHDVSINHPNPIGLIEDLRGNIQQLREQNLSLRKVILGKPPTPITQRNDQSNTVISNYSSVNENLSPLMELNRPQSASQDNNRSRYNSKESFIHRSNSFKNYS